MCADRSSWSRIERYIEAREEEAAGGSAGRKMSVMAKLQVLVAVLAILAVAAQARVAAASPVACALCVGIIDTIEKVFQQNETLSYLQAITTRACNTFHTLAWCEQNLLPRLPSILEVRSGSPPRPAPLSSSRPLSNASRRLASAQTSTFVRRTRARRASARSGSISSALSASRSSTRPRSAAPHPPHPHPPSPPSP